MTQKFFTRDIEHKTALGEKVIEKDVLHFEFKQEPNNGGTVGIEFCDRATEQHIAQHPKAWADFQNKGEATEEVKAAIKEASVLSAGTIEEAKVSKKSKKK